ncbi:hypothetical protein MJH12_04280 [bacterium]|nr:hypothetical protein [bacterium]
MSFELYCIQKPEIRTTYLVRVKDFGEIYLEADNNQLTFIQGEIDKPSINITLTTLEPVAPNFSTQVNLSKTITNLLDLQYTVKLDGQIIDSNLPIPFTKNSNITFDIISFAIDVNDHKGEVTFELSGDQLTTKTIKYVFYKRPIITLELALSSNVKEGVLQEPVGLKLKLSSPVHKAITLLLESFDSDLPGNYVGPTDFTIYPDQIVILPGLTEVIFNGFHIQDDLIDEDIEILPLRLIPKNGLFYDFAGPLLLQIEDDNDTGVLTVEFDNILANEGESTTLRVTKTNIEKIINIPLSLFQSNLPNVANESDYTFTNLQQNTIHLTRTDTTALINLNIIADNLVEGNETLAFEFLVQEQNEVSLKYSLEHKSIEIIDGDILQFRINAESNNKVSNEGDNSGQTMIVEVINNTITRTEVITFDITITGAASGSTDIGLVNQSYTIPINQNSLSIPLQIINDSVKELNEILEIHISNVVGADFVDPNTFTHTILNDDNQSPQIESLVISGLAAKDEILTASADISDPDLIDQNTLVKNYQWQTSIDQLNWVDLDNEINTTYTIKASDVFKSIRIVLSVSDGTETLTRFSETLDIQPKVFFTTTAVSVLEGDIANPTVQIDQLSNEDVTVYFEILETANATQNDVAFGSTNYKELYRVIKKGESYATLPLKALYDAVSDPTESLTIRITRVQGAIIGTQSDFILTILPKVFSPNLNNPNKPTISIVSATPSLGEIPSDAIFKLEVNASLNNTVGTLKVKKLVSLDNGLTWYVEKLNTGLDGNTILSNETNTTLWFNLDKAYYSHAIKFKVEVLTDNGSTITLGDSKITPQHFEHYSNKMPTFATIPNYLHSFHSSAMYKDKIYYFGGSAKYYVNNNSHEQSDSYFTSFDPLTEIWTDLPAAPSHRRNHMSFVFQDKFYVYGGLDVKDQDQNSMLIYDFILKTWTTLPTNGPILDRSAITIKNNKAYFWGGTNQNKILWEYNITSNQFTELNTYVSGMKEVSTFSAYSTQHLCTIGYDLYLIEGLSSSHEINSYRYGKIRYAKLNLLDSDPTVIFKEIEVRSTNDITFGFEYECVGSHLYISDSTSNSYINKIDLLLDENQIVEAYNTFTKNHFRSHSIESFDNKLYLIRNNLESHTKYFKTPYYESDAIDIETNNEQVEYIGNDIQLSFDIVSDINSPIWVSYEMNGQAIPSNYFEGEINQFTIGQSNVSHTLNLSKLSLTPGEDVQFKAHLKDQNGSRKTIEFTPIDILRSLETKMLKPTILRSNYAYAINDQNLFIWGGRHGEDTFNHLRKLVSLESYSFALNSWTLVDNIYTDHTILPGLAVHTNGANVDLFITGGANGKLDGEVSRQFFKYSVNFKTKTNLKKLPFKRFGHKSIIIGNLLYLIGGSNITNASGKPGSSINSIDIYNVVSNIWETPIKDIISNVNAVQVMGRNLYILGDNLIQQVNLDSKELKLIQNVPIVYKDSNSRYIKQDYIALGKLDYYLVVSPDNSSDIQVFDTNTGQWLIDKIASELNSKAKYLHLVSNGINTFAMGYDKSPQLNELNLTQIKLNSSFSVKREKFGDYGYKFSATKPLKKVTIISTRNRGFTEETIVVDAENGEFKYSFVENQTDFRQLQITFITTGDEEFTIHRNYYVDAIDYCAKVTSVSVVSPSKYISDVKVILDLPRNDITALHYVDGSIESERYYYASNTPSNTEFLIPNVTLTNHPTKNQLVVYTQSGCKSTHTLNMADIAFNPVFTISDVHNTKSHRINNPYVSSKNYPEIEFETDTPIILQTLSMVYPLTTNGEEWEVIHNKPTEHKKTFYKPGKYRFTLTDGTLTDTKDNVTQLPFGSYNINLKIISISNSLDFKLIPLKLGNDTVNFEMTH